MNTAERLDYEDHHERKAHLLGEAEDRERTRMALADTAQAIKADLHALKHDVDALRQIAHASDDGLLTTAETLLDEALYEISNAWPERAHGGRDARIAALTAENTRLKRAIHKERADLSAAIAQRKDLLRQNHSLRKALRQQTEKVEGLRELASAQALVEKLSLPGSYPRRQHHGN